MDENVLYVEDGRIITSAGTAAGIDACLHLVRVEFGANVAAGIARDMVVPPHRDGGQAQFIDRPIPQCGSEPMEELLQWMVRHLEEDHSVNELAARVHMSPRTFARRFRSETGATPAAWLNSQRVLRAQELLETTDLNIDEIARESGFGHSVLLRHHFAKVLDTSPQSYRRTFRGHLAAALGRLAGTAPPTPAARPRPGRVSTRSRHGPVTACSGRVARCWPARMLYRNRSGWPRSPRPARGTASHGQASISGCQRSVSSGGVGWTVHVRFMPAMPPLRWTVIFIGLGSSCGTLGLAA